MGESVGKISIAGQGSAVLLEKFIEKNLWKKSTSEFHLTDLIRLLSSTIPLIVVNPFDIE